MNDPFVPKSAETLPRTLGATTALCVVVGSVIGSGIFLVPARVATNVPNMAGIIALWVVGGLFSLAGALTLAELGAMIPKAGGPYVFLREAYGRVPAFLFGWTEFLVIRSGSVATLASAFAIYAAQPQLFPKPAGLDARVWQSILAVSAITLVAVINILGTRASGSVQVIGTVLKLGALGGMIALPFFRGEAHLSNWTPFWPGPKSGAGFAGIMAAMISVLWAYDGWVNATSMAEEVRDPGRNIPRALILGTAILIAVYLSMTLVYHLVLPMATIQEGANSGRGSGKEVAAVFCKTLLGDRGGLAIALIVACSTLISLNGNALSGPRAYFAMARDGLFPERLCRIHPIFQTPANAILAQAIWSIALIALATTFLVIDPPTGLPRVIGNTWRTFHDKPIYDVMYDYVIFGGTVLYTLVGTSVFVLRRTQPDLHRPYKTWGYPVTPILYVAASCLLIYGMLSNEQSRFESLAGLGIILLGLPAFLLFSHDRPHVIT